MDEGQAPDEVLAMLTLDGEGHILQCNGAMTDLSGYTQRELCSRHVSSIFPGLMYLHLLDEQGINPKLRYLCLAGFPFRLRRQEVNKRDNVEGHHDCWALQQYPVMGPIRRAAHVQGRSLWQRP